MYVFLYYFIKFAFLLMEICLFDEYALLLKETGSSSSYHANIKDEQQQQQQQSMKTKDEIFKKFPSFKQFDFVNDASDHHFIHKKCPLNQASLFIHSFILIHCFCSNLNYKGLQCTHFLNSIQIIGRMQSRKTGKFWRRICRVGLLCVQFSIVIMEFCSISSCFSTLLSLSDSIFVRAYKSKMNLLRAVIIGPKGTPYQHGLFFFDFYFPSNYPIVPPVCR